MYFTNEHVCILTVLKTFFTEHVIQKFEITTLKEHLVIFIKKKKNRIQLGKKRNRVLQIYYLFLGTTTALLYLPCQTENTKLRRLSAIVGASYIYCWHVHL